MMDLEHAAVRTSGAYVLYCGLYVFTIGWKPHNGNIPVVRLGGHVEEGESGWECAAREVKEEARITITPIQPRRTYLVQGEDTQLKMTEIAWDRDSGDGQPLLVVAYPRESETALSLMFLAETGEMPEPSAEVKGILLLDLESIEQICQGTLTLDQYLKRGGQAMLRHDFDRNMRLEPFIQLRILAKMLKMRLV